MYSLGIGIEEYNKLVLEETTGELVLCCMALWFPVTGLLVVVASDRDALVGCQVYGVVYYACVV